MAALHLHRVLQAFTANTASLLRLVLLYRLQQPFPVLLFGKLGIVDSSPSLFLGLLEILLQLPACLVVRPIVQVEAAVAKRAVSGVMPVLAQILHIVESAAVLDCGIQTRRAHLFLVGLLSILNIVVGELVIGIAIHPPVNFCVQLALLYQLRCLHIIQKPLFRYLFLKLVSSQLQIFDQVFARLVVYAFELLMDRLPDLLISLESVIADQVLLLASREQLFDAFFWLILTLLLDIVGILFSKVFDSLILHS